MTAPDRLISAVAAEVSANGDTWFPELGGKAPQVHFVTGKTRSRCFLYRFEVTDGHLTRPIMVKVRHSDPNLRRLDLWEDRPVLAPVRTMSDEATARREYEGLQLIADTFCQEDTPRFGVLRPLAWLPEHAAIVTDLVEQPTLRTVLLGTTRFRLGPKVRLDDTPWHNAGAWLRMFHDHPTSLSLVPRAESPASVGDLYRQFADFLLDRTGRRSVLDELSRSGPEIAASALPADLPLRTGHGDFVPTNMFTTPEGRITVFDPLPVWQAPAYQDIATLLVGFRALPSQAVTQGLALPRSALAGYRAAFLRGYFGTVPVPHAPVLAFELLVLLDKWSGLVSRQVRHGRLRPHLRQARIRIASRHYREEVRRVLRQLEGSPATTPRNHGV